MLAAKYMPPPVASPMAATVHKPAAHSLLSLSAPTTPPKKAARANLINISSHEIIKGKVTKCYFIPWPPRAGLCKITAFAIRLPCACLERPS